MKLTKQKKQHLILVGMLTLMICGGLWFGLIQHQNRRLTAISLSVEQARSRQSDIDKLISMRKLIEMDLDANLKKLSGIEASFAEGDLYSWFIIKLREFQAAYVVETPQINREVVGDMSLLPEFPYRQATYAIRGVAHFEELGRFLAGFENRFPFFRLLNLELEADAGGTSPDAEKLNFRVDVSTLIKPSSVPAE